MRAWFCTPCLLSSAPEASAEAAEAARRKNLRQYRAVLAQIARPGSAPAQSPPHDLPDAIRDLIAAWIRVQEQSRD